LNHRKTQPFYVPDGDKFNLTYHVEQRMAQRNISWDDIHFVLQYGQRFHKAGAIHIFLRSRDIPQEMRAKKRFSRLEGTTIVVSRDDLGSIITVHRNRRNGAKNLRCKRRNSRYSKHYEFH
jgi:hypothetical protein